VKHDNHGPIELAGFALAFIAVAGSMAAGCAPESPEPDIAAVTCDEVECPGGTRSEFIDAGDVVVVCEFECAMMDEQPTRLTRAWLAPDGECFRLQHQWRTPLEGDECW